MQKGFVGIPALILLAVLALIGAYYVGTTASPVFFGAGKLPSVNISLTPPLPPEVSNLSSPSPLPQISPTPTTKQITKLKYNLPAGWKTVQNKLKTLEAGYDANIANPYPGDQSINFRFVQYPGSSFGTTILPYDGGSRHQFIYKQGPNPQDKMKDYYEKEYLYNSWSCLVLYGLAFSAKGTTWGMCAISPSQALFIEGTDEENTEQFIQTIKLLKTP